MCDVTLVELLAVRFNYSSTIVTIVPDRSRPYSTNGLFTLNQSLPSNLLYGSAGISVQVACLYFTEVHVETWLTENNSWNCAGVMGLSLRRRLLNFL